jgi:hypothetical protein
LRAIAQALAIARARPIETLLLLAVLALCMAVGIFIGALLAAGLVPALGLSASICPTGASAATSR